MWPKEDVLNVSRDEMKIRIRRQFEKKFAETQIFNYEHSTSRSQDVDAIIKHLRLMNHSTLDFREAKEKLNVYSLDRLEACYLNIILRELRYARREENRENALQYVLKKHDCKDLDELKDKSGWEKDKNGIYHCPKVERTKELPDVLGKFNEVLYQGSKRVGYRGKKNEAHEQSIRQSTKSDNTNAKAVYSKSLSTLWRGDRRFVIVDTITGKVLDDAQGYGYRSKEKAYESWNYKNSKDYEIKVKQKHQVIEEYERRMNSTEEK